MGSFGAGGDFHSLTCPSSISSASHGIAHPPIRGAMKDGVCEAAAARCMPEPCRWHENTQMPQKTKQKRQQDNGYNMCGPSGERRGDINCEKKKTAASVDLHGRVKRITLIREQNNVKLSETAPN